MALHELAIEIAELRDLQQVLDTAMRHCLDLAESRFGILEPSGPGHTWYIRYVCRESLDPARF
jgi:hypothetical protein